MFANKFFIVLSMVGGLLMADILEFNSTTHPTVKLEDDYNNLLRHGLEKGFTYLVRQNGSYFEAIKGSTNTGAGTVVYGGQLNAGSTLGTSASAVFAAIPAGSKIAIGEGTFPAQILYRSGDMYIGSGVAKTIIQQNVNAQAVFKPSLTTAKTRLYLSDLTIDLTNDASGSSCLNLDGTCYASTERVTLSNHAGSKTNCTAVYLADTHQVGCYFNTFRDVDVAYFNIGYNFATTSDWTPNSNQIYSGRVLTSNTGIKFNAETTGDHPNGNCIFGTDFEACGTGIDAECSDNSMYGGNLETNSNYDIYIASGKMFSAYGTKLYRQKDYGPGILNAYPCNPLGTRVYDIPTVTGWIPTIVNSGTLTNVMPLEVATGTDPNSSAKGTMLLRGLFTNFFSALIDWTKQFELDFTCEKIGNYNQTVAYVTIGAVGSDGVLTGSGLGFLVTDFNCYGQSYGTSQQTLNLTTALTEEYMADVRIVFIPNSKLQFWINGELKATQTTTAKLPTGSPQAWFNIGIYNGAAGGVNQYFHIQNIKITQQV
jgi:hypothetical protein